MSSNSEPRRSKRVLEKATMPAAKESRKAANKRDQWLLKNEQELETSFDFLYELLRQKGEDNVAEEGDRTFTNFAAICADELCPDVERIYNDDSTDDEDEVDGLGSEDEEEEEEEEDEEEEETADDLEEEIDDLLDEDDEEEEEEEEEDEE